LSAKFESVTGKTLEYIKELEIGRLNQVIMYCRYDYIQVIHNVSHSKDCGRSVK